MNNKISINEKELPNSLDKDEMIKLFNEYRKGSLAARNKIIEHNIRLVILIVNRIYTMYVDKDDLFSIGCEGLIKAVDSFDVSKNITFSTYATRCINNEILMYFRKTKNDKYFISMEMVIGNNEDGDEQTLKDTLASSDDIVINYEDKEIYKVIKNYIEELDEEKRNIFKLYYGFDQIRTYLQVEIAKKTGLSQAHISRVISKCTEQIKNKLCENNYIQLKDNQISVSTKRGNSLCKYLNATKDELEMVLSNLSIEYQTIINKRYPEGVDKDIFGILDEKEMKIFYSKLIPVLKDELNSEKNNEEMIKTLKLK